MRSAIDEAVSATNLQYKILVGIEAYQALELGYALAKVVRKVPGAIRALSDLIKGRGHGRRPAPAGVATESAKAGELTPEGAGSSGPKPQGPRVPREPHGGRPRLDRVPSVRGGEFDKWFDSLTPSEFKKVWANPDLQASIRARLRHPGGFHEWLPVSRANKFKSWGVSAEQIRALRSPTSEVRFVNPAGSHGGFGSTRAHNEIIRIIDTSGSYREFARRLQG